MNKAYSVTEATRALERYCAYQERCHKEVATKLRTMRMIPQAIDQIIAHLIQENFLNEERFARAYARGKFTIKSWGKRKIVQELKRRDISHYIITSALQEIDDADYLATLDRIFLKKIDSLTKEPLLIKKKKVIDYLSYRGWENELIYAKVNEFL